MTPKLALASQLPRTASSFSGWIPSASPRSLSRNFRLFLPSENESPLTCVPRLKPRPVILLPANFVAMLLLQFLRFPLKQGDSDPGRVVAIISSSWPEMFRQEVNGFDGLLNVSKRHLLAEKRSLQQLVVDELYVIIYFDCTVNAKKLRNSVACGSVVIFAAHSLHVLLDSNKNNHTTI